MLLCHAGRTRRKTERIIFHLTAGQHQLREVIISFPQVVIQAQEHNHSVKREVTILAIHGVLHLLGYDHIEDDEAIMKPVRKSSSNLSWDLMALGLAGSPRRNGNTDKLLAEVLRRFQ